MAISIRGQQLRIGPVARAINRVRRNVPQFSGGHFTREKIASTYLRGTGIEIGALHNPLRLPRRARVRYVDRMSVEDLRAQYPELVNQSLVPVDIVDDGERLQTVATATQDFVIANHFLEHCQNPISAIEQMLRVLRPGGVLYLAIPDKRYTFDSPRPSTSIAHVLGDYYGTSLTTKRQHVEEWVRMVEKVTDLTDVERHVDHLLAVDYSIHYHVWTQADLFDLLSALKTQLGLRFDIECFVKRGYEAVFILRTDRDS